MEIGGVVHVSQDVYRLEVQLHLVMSSACLGKGCSERTLCHRATHDVVPMQE